MIVKKTSNRCKMKQSIFLGACILLQLVCVVIFLKGFFPIKSSAPGFSTWNDFQFDPRTNDSENYGHNETGQQLSPSFGKIIFVLIDALRADFVLPKANGTLPFMKFLRSKIASSSSKAFLAKAHPPTVTLPRIKGLMTGGIPGFIDVVLNFGSDALIEDSFLNQIKHAGKKALFYGDDTWIRLFPENFIRKDGTTSFFVSDYTEVDDNVTRHIADEFGRDDWDVMILHYLGLDHIGHLAGPYSPLVDPKLKEMDDIVEFIHRKIIDQDKQSLKPSLLVVCGDHGMSEQGSHGGSTYSEVATPFVMLSSIWEGGKGSPYKEGSPILQTDVASTLSILFGMPPPKNSLGVVVQDALDHLPLKQQLQAVNIVAQQMTTILKSNVHSLENEPSYHLLEKAVTLHKSWLDLHESKSVDEIVLKLQASKVLEKYSFALNAIREKIASSLTNYDLHGMGMAIFMLLMLLYFFLKILADPSCDVDLYALPVFPILICILFLGIMHVTLCTSSHASPMLCSSNMVIQLCIWFMYILLSVLFTVMWSIERGLVIFKWLKDQNLLSLFLLAGTLFHSVTLVASSFVEEEHQTFYFFSVTAIIIYAFQIWKSFVLPTKLYFGAKEILDNRKSHERVGSKSGNDCYFDYQTKKKSKIVAARALVLLLVTLILARISRSWNRTGDKWSHLPDVGDWLVRPENKIILSMVCALSLLFIWILLPNHSCRSWRRFAMETASLLGIYCFRAANGVLYMGGVYPEGSISKGVTEARTVYALLCALIVYALIKYYSTYKDLKPGVTPNATLIKNVSTENLKDSSQAQESYYKLIKVTKTVVAVEDVLRVWTILVCLLVRPHNITVIVLEIAQIVCLQYVLLKESDVCKNHYIVLLYLWMGSCAYFHQGNSNSLATVDVSSGYIGLEEYNPLVIGLLMVLSTYSGPLLWLLAMVVVILRRNDAFSSSTFVVILMLSRTLPLCIYTILVSLQRYHLFVWSVFSPKLLYESMLTLVISIVGLILLLSMRTGRV